MAIPSAKERQKFSQYAARHGFAKTLYRSLMGRIREFLMLAHVTTRVLKGDVSQIFDPRFSIKIASREEMKIACVAMPDQLNCDDIDIAFDRGDICIATFDKEQIIAFVWRCYSQTEHEPGVWIAAHKPYRYGYKSYTMPAYRGRQLNPPPHITDPICVSKGYTHGIAFVETHNFASVQSSLHHNNEFVGYAGYVRLFGKVITFRTPGAKRHKFSFMSRSKV